MAEYRVVPFIGQVKEGDPRGAQKVAEQLEALINEQARQGWEFVNVVRVQMAIRPGCLASLFGAKTAVVGFDQVVFRRA